MPIDPGSRRMAAPVWPGAREAEGSPLAGSARARVAHAGGPTILAAACAGTSLILVVWLAARTVHWPLVHDAALMHYVAQRLLAGAVPYRDLFDMNFPLVYVAHVAALSLLGPGDLAFRVFDLALLVVTGAGLVVALWPYGRVAAASACALFALYHVSGGPWLAGQRELVLCATLAWAAAGTLRVAGPPGGSGRPLGWLGLAGLAFGVAVWIKPHAAALALPLLGWLVGRSRSPWRALGVLVLVVGTPALGVLGWLAATGGLGPFVDLVVGYLLPLYGRLGRADSLLDELLGRDYGWPVLAGLGSWLLGGGLALSIGSARDRRPIVLWTGVLYGVAHFWIQGRGWDYHLYPLALGAIMLGAAGLGVAVAAARPGATIGLALLLIGTASGFVAKGNRNLGPDWIRTKQARVQAMVDHLGLVVAAGGAVQVFDTSEGGIDALYRLGARQPTRFLYDFPFYHDVDHPYVRRLRAELLADLAARPPAAVVLLERGWPAGDYGRVSAFPALAGWLAHRYHLAHQGEGFRIYAARGDR